MGMVSLNRTFETASNEQVMWDSRGYRNLNLLGLYRRSKDKRNFRDQQREHFVPTSRLN